MKRSANVGLLLMGAAAIGGTGYALMPRADCVPAGSPPAAAAGVNPGNPVNPSQACPPSGRSSSSSGSSSSRWWSSSSHGSSSGSSGSDSGHASSSRGGFGSTGGSGHASS